MAPWAVVKAIRQPAHAPVKSRAQISDNRPIGSVCAVEHTQVVDLPVGAPQCRRAFFCPRLRRKESPRANFAHVSVRWASAPRVTPSVRKSWSLFPVSEAHRSSCTNQLDPDRARPSSEPQMLGCLGWARSAGATVSSAAAIFAYSAIFSTKLFRVVSSDVLSAIF